MSIIITNISESKGKDYGRGTQHYVLCINERKYIEFTHDFKDGLSTCLRKAADAFEKMEEDKEEPIYLKERKLELMKMLIDGGV